MALELKLFYLMLFPKSIVKIVFKAGLVHLIAGDNSAVFKKTELYTAKIKSFVFYISGIKLQQLQYKMKIVKSKCLLLASFLVNIKTSTIFSVTLWSCCSQITD